jgi:hypothetical protein
MVYDTTTCEGYRFQFNESELFLEALRGCFGQSERYLAVASQSALATALIIGHLVKYSTATRMCSSPRIDVGNGPT